MSAKYIPSTRLFKEDAFVFICSAFTIHTRTIDLRPHLRLSNSVKKTEIVAVNCYERVLFRAIFLNEILFL